MSNIGRIVISTIVLVFAVASYADLAKADVTGSFSIHISFQPQTTVREIDKLEFDFQSRLSLIWVVSGLRSSLIIDMGLAGPENVIAGFGTTLGALDLHALLVFSRFAGNGDFRTWDIWPDKNTLHFVKKRVRTTLTIGGVSFENLAIFEDTNFREIGPPLFKFDQVPIKSQTPAYAFGDVLSVRGQTPSNITIEMNFGICAEQKWNQIKKHRWYYIVNEHCATEPKPDILFDFEKIYITGIPIAPGIMKDIHIVCLTIGPCTLTNILKFTGGIIPFETEIVFTDVLSLVFGGATLVFQAGAGTLTIGITPTGTIGAVGVDLAATLNPDTNPATLIIDAEIVPGVGLTSAVVALSITKSGFRLQASAIFAGGPPAVLQDMRFEIWQVSGFIDSHCALSFDVLPPAGLEHGDCWITFNF